MYLGVTPLDVAANTHVIHVCTVGNIHLSVKAWIGIMFLTEQTNYVT
jgi:hypothetical protein